MGSSSLGTINPGNIVGCRYQYTEDLVPRPQSWAGLNIAAKEMVPVVIGVALWGHDWAMSTLLVRSDIMAVVHTLTSRTAKDPLLMHLLRCLHFSASHQIGIQARHVLGVLNTAADAMSHNNMSIFFYCSPQAHNPCVVPDQLLDMLLLQRRDWTSPSWRRMFRSTWGTL